MKILKGITQSGMGPTIAALAAEYDERALHFSLTEDVIAEAVARTMFDEAMIGFCIDCGAEHSLCEPDAERFLCDECDALQVHGAEQLLLMTVA